jgi:hypothetical protein
MIPPFSISDEVPSLDTHLRLPLDVAQIRLHLQMMLAQPVSYLSVELNWIAYQMCHKRAACSYHHKQILAQLQG